jgi:primosomal replication protein N
MRVENNKVELTGTIITEPEFNHEVFGEGFYNMHLKVDRLSGTADIIPLIISERLINLNDKYTGTAVNVSGVYRSYNKHEEKRNRLLLDVFVCEIEKANPGEHADLNNIQLDGYVCKEPTYRKTPLGREIADLLIAVNRSYGKSDYIPCIVWGRNAVYTSGLPVGTHLKLTGRIQSRGYVKMHEDGTEEQRTAYEVSVSKINVLEEEN